MKKRVMMVFGIAGALAIGLFAIAAVGAQEDPTDTVTRPVDDLVSRVAEKLGVSEDEFVDAWNESAIDIVDEKVESGELTEEQGAAIKERIENSDGVWVPHRPHHGHHPRGLMLIATASQTVLDTEDGELREAFMNGESLLDVALEKGFTEEQFTADLLAEIQSILEQKVEDGDLDQENADAIYERISENISEIINHTKGDGPPWDGGLGLGQRGFGPGFGPGFDGPFGDDTDESADIDA